MRALQTQRRGAIMTRLVKSQVKIINMGEEEEVLIDLNSSKILILKTYSICFLEEEWGSERVSSIIKDKDREIISLDPEISTMRTHQAQFSAKWVHSW